MSKPETIKIDDVTYVREDSVTKNPLPLNGMKYCIVRTYSAGVFAGYLGGLKEKHGTVHNARRIWSWQGAATLSQLAMEGTSKPEKCKFPQEVNEVLLTEIIEVIPCTEKARLSIKGVKVWKE